MEIKFLGTGGAFDYKQGSASAVVEKDEKLFLIDAGPTVYPALCDHGLIDKIDYVLITHLHGDHVGGLFQVMCHHNVFFKRKLHIIVPTDNFKEELRRFLALHFKFDDDVDYHSIEDFEGIGYIDTFGQHVPEMPSFAYYFADADELIYYSGDLGVLDTTVNFLGSRSEQSIRVFEDINAKEGPGHVYYKEASERLAGYDAYGYHCDKVTMPADNTLLLVEDYPELNY